MLGGFFGGGSSSSDNNSNDNTTSSTPSAPTGLSSPSPFSGLGSSPSDTKTKLQNAITTQTNLINAKYLITKINENCFEHCVPNPGDSLSRGEQTCLSTCMEKYIDGWNVVSKTYVQRLQREGAQLQAQGGIGGL